MYLLPIALLAAFATAQSAPSNHPYRAPAKNSVRSPCPGLNSLANHGFLPRSGRGMSLPILIKGLKEGLNVGADFSTAIGGAGLASSPTLLASSFDLDDLDEHNFPIEHDASLSRQDAFFGDPQPFNQTVFDQVLAFYEGMEATSIPVASRARYARVETQRAINPEFQYGARELVLSYGETALYLSTMGDPVTGVAPLEYVKSLFEKERLPYELGWTPTEAETNLLTLGGMIGQLQAANPDAVAEGLTLGTGTLKDVYSLIDPLSGKAVNLTCALAGLC